MTNNSSWMQSSIIKITKNSVSVVVLKISVLDIVP